MTRGAMSDRRKIEVSGTAEDIGRIRSGADDLDCGISHFVIGLMRLHFLGGRLEEHIADVRAAATHREHLHGIASLGGHAKAAASRGETTPHVSSTPSK
jgi:hypothetical protein